MKRRTGDKKILIRAAAVLVGLSAALFAFAFRDVFLSGPGGQEEAPAVVFRHPLNGQPVEKETRNKQVYGVVVENMVEAWPQSGLDKASLVFEAPVEARIPRLLAFFPEDTQVDRVGPVRSARPYFIDWNAELDALFAHVGGSPAALDTLKRDDTIDLDEFSNEWFFWRDGNRAAPHNVYTSTEKLAEGLVRFTSRFGKKEMDWQPWKFGDAARTGVPATRVQVDFAGAPYVVEWVFDPGKNFYERYQDGGKHVMQDGAGIFASNVVVIETDVEVLDSVGRRRLRTLGVGDGWLYQNGLAQNIRWRKPSREERLRFFRVLEDSTEEEVVMVPGATWIEVLPTLTSLTHTP